MALYFDHVFTGVRMRGFHNGHQDFIQNISAAGVDDVAVIEAMGLKSFIILRRLAVGGGGVRSGTDASAAEDGAGNGDSVRTGYFDHTDPARTRWCCYGCNCQSFHGRVNQYP